MVVAKDKSRALITYIKVMAQPNKRSTLIKPMGLVQMQAIGYYAIKKYSVWKVMFCKATPS